MPYKSLLSWKEELYVEQRGRMLCERGVGFGSLRIKFHEQPPGGRLFAVALVSRSFMDQSSQQAAKQSAAGSYSCMRIEGARQASLQQKITETLLHNRVPPHGV